MLLLRPPALVCRACRVHYQSLLSRGSTKHHALHPRPPAHSAATRTCLRAFHKLFPARSIFNETQSTFSRTEAELEATVRKAWETHGHSLPQGKLSTEGLALYAKLYGTPTFVSELQQTSEDGEADTAHSSALDRNGTMQEDAPAAMEEVEYADESGFDHETEQVLLNEMQKEAVESEKMYQAYRTMPFSRDNPARDDEAKSGAPAEESFEVEEEEEHEELDPEEQAQENARLEERLQAERDYDEIQTNHESGDVRRTHPYTLAARSETVPSTVFLPKDTVVDPIQQILSTASNKHLHEKATEVFGGPSLPNSVATLSTKDHLQSKPVALEASQSYMIPMEANAYLAANLPGIYVSVTSVLVEIRRRLGSEWLEDLLKRPNGPRILDAGGAGAGVLAWRDVLRAEWERIHPTRPTVPFGQATAVVGSTELGIRTSSLLEETTIIPRMPEFVPSRDLPASKDPDQPARKVYDIVIAPHTLWTLKEDYMRKRQVQNYWSLLDPNGGVLIVLEKGLPRGFELVAGARETLLKHHISSPGAEQAGQDILLEAEPRHPKEPGMIIAPCTNHGTCPMYTIPGEMVGRKSHCHFQQRFIRPAFLQNMVGRSGRSHEDIRYSYVAVQRGRDLRRESNIAQDEAATLAALEGFEAAESQPSMLALPRILLPPLKRHKHVVFDVCTPSAQLERWTIPASKSKQGYRDARKSRWGDLWALGAKTRILRDARSGRPPKEVEVRKKGSPSTRQKGNKKRRGGGGNGADEDEDDHNHVEKKEETDEPANAGRRAVSKSKSRPRLNKIPVLGKEALEVSKE